MTRQIEPAKNPKTGKQIRRKPNRGKYDWNLMRRQFIEGIPKPDGDEERWFPNLKELAEMHEASYIQVRKRSSEDRWPVHKEAHQITAIRERQEKRAKMIAKNALDFDEKTHKVAQLGLAMVTTRIAEIAEEAQTKKPFRDDAVQRLKNGEHVEPQDLWSAIRYKELEGLANAAERFQNIGMKALGTDVQRVDVTGLEGGNTTVNVVNVSQEMQRDDPDRMASMFEAMSEAGLVPDELLSAMSQGAIAGKVIDAEVIPEDDADREQLPNDLVDNDVTEDSE